MLAGLVLGAVAAGAVSLAVGPAMLASVLFGQPSTLSTPSDSPQVGVAIGQDTSPAGKPPAGAATTTGGGAVSSTTTSAAPTTTGTTVAPTPSTSAAPTTTATVAPAPTTVRQTTKQSSTPRARVLELVNQARSNAGCKPLRADSRLDTVALDHSEDMSRNDYFDHTSQDGRTFADRADQAGYPSPGGENIAQGYRTADAVMDSWMHSDGHRRNILNCGFVAIGIGLTTNGFYWVQDFGR
jgi:uncharacterized protein YkwD